MRILKAIMIVTVLASALSLGACAQKKETMATANDGHLPSRNKLPPADSFNLKARSSAAWPFFTSPFLARHTPVIPSPEEAKSLWSPLNRTIERFSHRPCSDAPVQACGMLSFSPHSLELLMRRALSFRDQAAKIALWNFRLSISLAQLNAVATGNERIELTDESRTVFANRARLSKKFSSRARSSTASAPVSASSPMFKLSRKRSASSNSILCAAIPAALAPLSIPEVRAMMFLRANVLALGFSGIRLEVIEFLSQMLNRGVSSGHPGERLGRRERRSRSSGASGPRVDRRRRSFF